MICRRCGHEHAALHCPLCGQPRPDQIATEQQRRAFRQRLHVTAVLPPDVAERLGPLLEQASYRADESQRVLATFTEDRLAPLLKLWEAIAEDPRCELLFNGRRRPYDRELWIPLMWIAGA